MDYNDPDFVVHFILIFVNVHTCFDHSTDHMPKFMM